MTDIVERLHQGAGHIPVDVVEAEKVMAEAADEIERLLAANADLELRAKALDKHAAQLEAEIKRLRALVRELEQSERNRDFKNKLKQAEIERLTHECKTWHDCYDNERRECERLRKLLYDITIAWHCGPDSDVSRLIEDYNAHSVPGYWNDAMTPYE